ncbi:MAG: ATP-binding protein [Jiangellaceae bacterium]
MVTVTLRDAQRHPPELRLPLSTDPGEVPRVRRLVREQLRTWRIPDPEDVTLLLVSELVTNALLHGRPPLELRVSCQDLRVRVEVHDAAGDQPPALTFPPLDAQHGRGIEILAALSSRWGSAPSPAGKVVWFEVDARHARR